MPQTGRKSRTRYKRLVSDVSGVRFSKQECPRERAINREGCCSVNTWHVLSSPSPYRPRSSRDISVCCADGKIPCVYLDAELNNGFVPETHARRMISANAEIVFRLIEFCRYGLTSKLAAMISAELKSAFLAKLFRRR